VWAEAVKDSESYLTQIRVRRSRTRRSGSYLVGQVFAMSEDGKDLLLPLDIPLERSKLTPVEQFTAHHLYMMEQSPAVSLELSFFSRFAQALTADLCSHSSSWG